MQLATTRFITFSTVTFAVVLVLLSPEKVNEEGRINYERMCKKCHTLFEEAAGSPMYGMLERAPDKEWMYNYIKNPPLTRATDPYAACLKKKYGTEMAAIAITDAEIDSIFSYVYAEAKKRNEIWNNKKFFIPCK